MPVKRWKSTTAPDCWAPRVMGAAERPVRVMNLGIGAHCSWPMWTSDDLRNKSDTGSWTQGQQTRATLPTWRASVRAANSHHTLEQTTKHPICQAANRGLVVPSYRRFTLTHVGKTLCVPLNVATSSASALQKGLGAGKPACYFLLYPSNQRTDLLHCILLHCFPPPSSQGYLFFSVFQRQYFPRTAFLIWTSGLEIMDHNC